MGLSIRLRPNQEAQWKLFFSRATEILKEKGLIAMPISKAGYGYLGNPFVVETLWQFSEINPADSPYPIFLISNNKEILNQISSINKIGRELTDKYWPGELIVRFPIKNINFKFKDKEFQLELGEQKQEIFLFNPISKYIQNFLSFLEEKNLPPILLGQFALDDNNQPIINSQQLIDYTDSVIVQMMFDAGTLQKSSKYKMIAIVDFPNLNEDEVIKINDNNDYDNGEGNNNLTNGIKNQSINNKNNLSSEVKKERSSISSNDKLNYNEVKQPEILSLDNALISKIDLMKVLQIIPEKVKNDENVDEDEEYWMVDEDDEI